jgi:hypothetical protein
MARNDQRAIVRGPDNGPPDRGPKLGQRLTEDGTPTIRQEAMVRLNHGGKLVGAWLDEDLAVFGRRTERRES